MQTEQREPRKRDAKREDKRDDKREDRRRPKKDESAPNTDAPATDANAGEKRDNRDGKDKKEGELAAGFRYNPALRAPVPVAQPKSTGGSERLRALANEIAQKIVERVRVGTNAAGNSEFQIDLRGDVLGGMSIKVSAKNGKISAVFSGKDREVLKMLEQQREGLKTALSGRGLTLESLKVEARS